ncbi:BZ3500_MvSof-1268-A1-R1_Chr4-2g07048 [Microbotryum saponariae]|uniref:BZ3500_MvSof-1268-A1-R1_Chr4-2g07048 protein n=1 Tax=Microbotryum saponariae TaxID=289078 RepID=A0A2X0M3Y3_9BASI|nr:BZ3500_MvSof-1268-A1-R1_Chr4-2g07048 [Microbotryum saponariae]SDA06713.1 BZ3501_MvSof-1269-A2-R1_Chr4-2g06759 [Microbotryum saponariae]
MDAQTPAQHRAGNPSSEAYWLFFPPFGAPSVFFFSVVPYLVVSAAFFDLVGETSGSAFFFCSASASFFSASWCEIVAESFLSSFKGEVASLRMLVVVSERLEDKVGWRSELRSIDRSWQVHWGTGGRSTDVNDVGTSRTDRLTSENMLA